MTREDLIELHESTCYAALETMRKKNNDYAGATKDTLHNFNSYLVVGVNPKKGILTRMIDKLSRLGNFADGQDMQVTESVDETIEDLINYAVLLKASFHDKIQVTE